MMFRSLPALRQISSKVFTSCLSATKSVRPVLCYTPMVRQLSCSVPSGSFRQGRACSCSVPAVQVNPTLEFAPPSSTNDLVTALQNEIEAEKRLEQENLGGTSPPAIPGFNIETKDAEVRLTKSHGEEKILVVFNVNHSVDVEDDFESEAAPVPVAMPPFTIEITKGDQRLCFSMDLVENDERSYDFRVEEFYIAPAVKGGADETVADNVYSSSGKYIDPNLNELFFLVYLEERGFTQDFCASLVNFATHYEHSQYVRLLSRIKDFVSMK